MKSVCTISTSETELILKTYMVTPTSTGGPVNLNCETDWNDNNETNKAAR